MINLLLHLFRLLPATVSSAMENLALRHQLALYKRTATRPRLRPADRLFWVWLARVWTGWRQGPRDRNPCYRSGGSGAASASTALSSPARLGWTVLLSARRMPPSACPLSVLHRDRTRCRSPTTPPPTMLGFLDHGARMVWSVSAEVCRP